MAESAAPRRSRVPALPLLIVSFLGLYAYFFQGGGWNQNSQLDVVRALVEQGSFEISDYVANTGDKSEYQGRIYSNKMPGQALIAAPLYAVVYGVARGVGLDPAEPDVVAASAYVITVGVSGGAALGLVILLYLYFRRRGASEREAFTLAAGFGSGSLLLPYSGVLMNHALCAFLVFAAWFLLDRRPARPRDLALAGVALGLAVLTEPSMLPVAAICVAVCLLRRPTPRELLALLAGPVVLAGVLFAHNYALFDNPFLTNRAYESGGFKDEGLFLDVLGWPQPMRLWWLTFHPFRGLFYYCPVLMIPFFGLWRRGPSAPSMDTRKRTDVGGRIAIVLTIFMVNLSFNGWTGGWSAGPRYLIPALPFLFSFALPGYRRLPVLSGVLIAASTLIMGVVTAVLVMIPAPNTGPPPAGQNPVLFCFGELAQGRVSISSQSVHEIVPYRGPDDEWDSWNWGERVGLRGAWSLLPVILLLAAVYGHALFGMPRERGDP